MARLNWEQITIQAAGIVESYSTSVTLRQLFYRLVSRGIIPNNVSAYKTLSKKTAEARRQGWFPDLIDRTRRIEKYQTFDSPEEAQDWVASIYRRDRTDGQEYQIFIAVEKAGMVVQLQSWFGDMGLPIMALGGYSSQTFVKTVGDAMMEEFRENHRPSILIYAGDFDPSGEDIDRDFIERMEQYLLSNAGAVGANYLSDIFMDPIRVGLLPEHIERYQLPEYPGKETDSRKWKFIDRHGKLVQVELDALDPNDLQTLYKSAVDEFFNYDKYRAILREERNDAWLLGQLVEKLSEVRDEEE